MSTEKTVDELLAELNSQPWNYYIDASASNRAIALKVAATLKNENLNELLSNADKIERWLDNPPIRFLNKKSPDAMPGAEKTVNKITMPL